MGYTIDITNITGGTSPYNIWVCNTGHTLCVYHDTITGTTASIDVLPPYSTGTTFSVKVVDDNGCINYSDFSF